MRGHLSLGQRVREHRGTRKQIRTSSDSSRQFERCSIGLDEEIASNRSKYCVVISQSSHDFRERGSDRSTKCQITKLNLTYCSIFLWQRFHTILLISPLLMKPTINNTECEGNIHEYNKDQQKSDANLSGATGLRSQKITTKSTKEYGLIRIQAEG